MIFHENGLLADNPHEISYLIFSKIGKDVARFVVCCSRDWCFKGLIKKLEASWGNTFQNIKFWPPDEINGVVRMLKRLRTSKGDYLIKQ